jgi:antibiotic biosynthesis monooxygenase (ABM) superfamily enzyme
MNTNGNNVSIEQDSPLVTTLEMLQVEPETQAALLDSLFAANAVRAMQPGFIAVAVMRSLDGLRVANYLQFRNQELLTQSEADAELVPKVVDYRARANQSSARHFKVRFVHRAEHYPASLLQAGIGAAAINEVTTTLEHQEKLLGFMTGVDEHARKQPGYLASNIHASDDGERIANVVQFDNAEIMLEGLERVMVDVTRERPDASLQSVTGLGTTDIHVYEVVTDASALQREEQPTATGSAQGFLNQIPARLTPSVRDSIDAVFGLELSGSEAGNYTIDSRSGTGQGFLTGRPGDHDLKPTATIRASSENFVKLMRGELSPMTAMMTGRIRLSGDLQAARGLQKIFGR